MAECVRQKENVNIESNTVKKADIRERKKDMP